MTSNRRKKTAWIWQQRYISRGEDTQNFSADPRQVGHPSRAQLHGVGIERNSGNSVAGTDRDPYRHTFVRDLLQYFGSHLFHVWSHSTLA